MPGCRATVYVKAAKHPTLIGVVVGAIADPTYPAPVHSVWEQSKHARVTLPETVQRFLQG
jgi:hypothetical protein